MERRTQQPRQERLSKVSTPHKSPALAFSSPRQLPPGYKAFSVLARPFYACNHPTSSHLIMYILIPYQSSKKGYQQGTQPITYPATPIPGTPLHLMPRAWENKCTQPLQPANSSLHPGNYCSVSALQIMVVPSTEQIRIWLCP